MVDVFGIGLGQNLGLLNKAIITKFEVCTGISQSRLELPEVLPQKFVYKKNNKGRLIPHDRNRE
jgi:hypothetical protein